MENIAFGIEAGEVVGVIGRNGAGKSTLLKVMSRVTSPTRGEIRLGGRVASLLEVGTGFHPDLTGRENVFLNGAILGMRRQETQRKLDEIVDFAGIAEFLDTPVKRYSSGMYLRLAFSVAAHLNVEILIVDEILAVGDAEFQRKCLGKMGDVASGGRTVIFVSHNLAAVQSLCSRALVLSQGTLAFDGLVQAGIGVYEEAFGVPHGSLDRSAFRGPMRDVVSFDRLELLQDESRIDFVNSERALQIVVAGRAAVRIPSYSGLLAVFRDGVRLFECWDVGEPRHLPQGEFECVWTLPPGLLLPGRYTIGIGGRRSEGGDWVWSSEAAAVEVAGRGATGPEFPGEGLLRIPFQVARKTASGAG